MFTFSQITNPGSREINEDAIGVSVNKDGCLFMVADGLGGHGMGDKASRLVISELKNAFEICEDLNSFFLNEVPNAQRLLLQKQTELNAQAMMKTTLVAVMVKNNTFQVCHIGDSRLYAFNKNKIKFRTLDHSVPQMLVMAREISEKKIRNHPDRNRLLKVMGTPWNENEQEIADEMSNDEVQAFLLCTDGFWELIEEKKMCKYLKKSKTVEEWLNLMNEEVQKNGYGKDMDNNSAIAIWID